MARGDYKTIWNDVLLRAPGAGAALCQSMVKDNFDRLCRRRTWSWMVKQGIFAPVNYYNIGRISVANQSNVITGVGTNWTQDMVGLQFRQSVNVPIYDIVAVHSATELVISQPWANATTTNSGYEIYRVYFETPSDFKEFVFGTLKDPSNQKRLWSNATQQQFDYYDAQRVQSQLPWSAAFFDYTRTYAGTIKPVLQVVGGGPDPVATTTFGYNFPADAVYVIEITTSGAVGVAEYQWKKNNGPYTTNVLSTDFPWDLSDGVQIYFPVGNYVDGDTFIIQTFAASTEGSPRYELWPHSKVNTYTYPYLYIIDVPLFDDKHPALPPFFSADVILEMSLATAAQFPGTDSAKNPYFSPVLYAQHTARAQQLIQELEKRDDETSIQDMCYQIDQFYNVPWLDGSFLQNHALGPYSP